MDLLEGKTLIKEFCEKHRWLDNTKQKIIKDDLIIKGKLNTSLFMLFYKKKGSLLINYYSVGSTLNTLFP